MPKFKTWTISYLTCFLNVLLWNLFDWNMCTTLSLPFLFSTDPLSLPFLFTFLCPSRFYLPSYPLPLPFLFTFLSSVPAVSPYLPILFPSLFCTSRSYIFPVFLNLLIICTSHSSLPHYFPSLQFHFPTLSPIVYLYQSRNLWIGV